MILTRLKLKDFRQYRGEHQLTFAHDESHNVTVITGMNGTGKTGLFYALNWCLYGDAQALPGSLINKAALQEEAFPTAVVELHFLHEGARYVCRREQVRTPNGSEREGSFTLQQLEAGGRVVDLKNAPERVNVILPRDARRYFFFDGERIDELARPGHEAEVKEAVRSVLKLKVLERAAQHLDETAKDYAKTLRSEGELTSEQEQLLVDSERLSEETLKLQGVIETGGVQVGDLTFQLSSVRNKLEQLADLKAIQVEEKSANETLERLQAEFTEIDRDLREAVDRTGPVVAGSAVQLAKQILEEKRAKGEIPTGIRQQLVEDLIRQGTCICGRPLDGDARAALAARHRDSVSTEVTEAVLEAAAEIRVIEAKGEDALARVRRSVGRRSELRDELTDAERQLQEIRRRLLFEFNEDVAELERTRSALEDRLLDARVELQRHERELEAARTDLAKTRSRLEAFASKSSEGFRTKRRYEIAASSADAARTLLHHFSTEMRARIEEATNDIFLRFVWKEKHFQAVRVTEDYRLEVVDRYDDRSLPGLSAGERQVLSLAFIAGMSKVTGEEAPLVIDTPFGRLSELPVSSIVTELPQLTKQLVLLVTDREIDNEARALLAPRIGREYDLSFDDETGTTSIVEVAP